MKLHNRRPDITNLYKIFRREKPSRATLFELFLNGPLYERLAGRKMPKDDIGAMNVLVDAYAAAGYDYASVHGCSMTFNVAQHARKDTISLNDAYVITDEASFDAYVAPRPETMDYSRLSAAREFLPDGMKLMVMGPGGVLENVISLTGYDNLCFMLADDPALTRRIFDMVGSTLLKYYECAVKYDTVGFVMSNDDWGFNTQTFLSPDDMRTYVFPWHKRIVDLSHANKLPIVLHSCGYFGEVMDDVIAMGYDAKHSFEDVILPIEDSYDRWHDRIALLGGIDVDYVIRKTDAEIKARARAMLVRGTTGYALGTGNSVPEYIPQEKYFALISTAFEGD